MSHKYDVIIPKTGLDVANDEEFGVGWDYRYFEDDYNALIYREIERGNAEAVYYLCMWAYEGAFYPHSRYDSLLECVLQDEKIDKIMFLIVFYMRKFWIRDRYTGTPPKPPVSLASSSYKREIVSQKVSIKNLLLEEGFNIVDLSKRFEEVWELTV